MKITLSKQQWEFIGKKAGWMKKSQEIRWFTWEDYPMGEKWDIVYRDIDSLYDEQGNALPKRILIEKMITKIQNANSDKPIPPNKIGAFLDRFPVLQDEFFEKVDETEEQFQDERRIEERDLHMEGLI